MPLDVNQWRAEPAGRLRAFEIHVYGAEYSLMRVRSDGQQTRERILEAACIVFGERGYRDATHVMICGEAEANKAAINHHYGDKKSLYRAVWQHLLDASDRDHSVSDIDNRIRS